MYEKDLATSLANIAVRRGRAGFTFDDLAPAARQHGGRFSELAEWLAQARSSGFVEDLGFDAIPGMPVVGPRRYRVAGYGGASADARHDPDQPLLREGPLGA